MFDRIISFENLCAAWREFKRGKLKKQDVLAWTDGLEENIFALHQKLADGSYCHGSYKSFIIYDPKRRQIHKASIRDRLLHHAIHRIIEPIFNPAFIYDSYASRTGKGLHRALGRLEQLSWKLSRNNTRVVWLLKCDIRKFFDSVDHQILFSFLRRKIKDERAMKLITGVVESFNKTPGNGLPLGNLTSQLFANVYLDALDQFITRELRVRNYVRYADDFVVISNDRDYLIGVLAQINNFIRAKLLLNLHPRKVTVSQWHSGIDFLGYISFPHHRVLRTKTKKRMFTKLTRNNLPQSRQSYLGLLKHCRGRGIKKFVEIDILKAMTKIILYTDGGARGNPGPAGAGIVIVDGNNQIIKQASKFLGETTNNEAEYQAVVFGLETLKQVFPKEKRADLEIENRLDSELVCKQLRHEYQLKEEKLFPWFIKISNLQITDFSHLNFIHIPREENSLADKLANEAMDQQSRTQGSLL